MNKAFEMDKKSELTIAMRKGLKEGEKKGLEKGQKEIALNIKKQGLDNDFIAKCLNISIEKLNKLLI